MPRRVPEFGRAPYRSCRALILLCALGVSPLSVRAAPALTASFLASGLSEALSDLGPFLDGPPPATSVSAGNVSTAGVSFSHRLWSVTLSGALDGAETGAVVLSGQDLHGSSDLNLSPVTLTGATDSHGPRAITLEVTTPRFLAGQQAPTAFKIFALTLGAAQADTALEAGSYADASADANAGAPLLDVFLGAGNCHSASRSFVIDELVYVAAQLARLTAHFQCGTRFAGVLRYDDLALSGTQTVEVEGRVWADENGDGVQAGDGLNRPDADRPDIKVDLFQDGVRVARRLTDSLGRFYFSVPAGSYQLGIETPRGMQVTLRDVGADEARDSDFDPVSARGEVFDTSGGAPAFVTIGLRPAHGQPKLPLPSTRLQPLLAGDRVSYLDRRRSEQTLTTDTVVPGVTAMNGSAARRVRDNAGNLQFVSNDARGLRLHRAVMLLADAVTVPPIRRHAVIDFSPPLVLLPASVKLGSFSATGSVTVRPLEATTGKARSVTLRYSISAQVTTDFVAGLAPGVLTSTNTTFGEMPTVSVGRTLRFSGSVDATPVSRQTTSYETFALDVGLINAYVPAVPRHAYATALRAGAGDDADGDRRADLYTLDIATRSPPGNAAPAAATLQTLRIAHPRLAASSVIDAGRVPATTILRGYFDADGVAELLTYDTASGLVSLLHPGQDAALARPLAFAAPGMRLFASGDFHHDGRRSLIWKSSNAVLSQWRLNGTPLPDVFQVTSQPGAALRVPSGWTMVGVGDFNADGASDLLWRETAGQRNVVWLMDGAVRIALQNLPRAEAQKRVLAVADFDGNAYSDVLWYEPRGRVLEAWLVNETGGVSRTRVGQSPSGARLMSSADYDGDGNADLLWRSGNRLALWLLRGATPYKSGPAGTLSSGNILLP